MEQHAVIHCILLHFDENDAYELICYDVYILYRRMTFIMMKYVLTEVITWLLEMKNESYS